MTPRPALTTLATLFALAACDNPNPGTPLGTFSVTSSLVASSCGAGVADPSPGSFQVTLSNDHGLIYWFPDTGAAAASGALGASGTVSIREVLADTVDAYDGGAGTCTLDRSDVLTFTLPPGASPASFKGSYAFTVAPAAGATCTDQLAATGGAYAALPCTIAYDLSGTRQ